jgi:hypothetical protein
MIRRNTGLKEVTWLMLASAALIGTACSDDDDDLYGGGGTSGSGTSGKNTGGSSTAGKTSGGSGGSTTAGSTTGGTGGSSVGGEATGGVPTDGGVGGEGGDASGGTPSEGGAGGAGGEGGEPFVADTLDNPGFEMGDNKSSTFPGWTNEATASAAYLEYATAHTGTGRLNHWTKWESAETPPYTARTYQTVSPIANGTYSFSMWVDREWFQEQYLYATGFDAADLEDEVTQSTEDANTPAGFFKITLSNIVVTSGSVTVGVYSAAPAGTWAGFDDAELTLVE